MKEDTKDASNTFEIKIDRLTFGGSGLGFKDGLATFVPYSVTEDIVEATYQIKKKNYANANIKNIITPSPHRTSALCPVFGQCGGCQWQMASYPHQLQAKKDVVIETFERIAKIPKSQLPIQDCVGMENPWNYRNKVQYPLQRDRSGKLLLGYYERQSHNIIDLDSCPVQSKIFEEILPQIKAVLSESQWHIYDEVHHQGILRHLCFRASERTGELLVILVARAGIPAKLTEKLLALKLPHLVGIVENINPVKTNIIYGIKNHVLWGRDNYFETILNKRFKVSTLSFFQTNTLQAEKIVRHVLEHLPENLSLAVDAFSGVGLFSLFLADKAQKVIAIEEATSSYEDAIENQKINNQNNIVWIKNKVEIVLQNMKEKPDLIFLDPPREGLRPETQTALLRQKPKFLIYLSCDPATLARDIKILTEGGYQVTEIVPFDLFPQTYHIETLVYLQAS